MDLPLNFSPIEVPAAEIKIGVLPYGEDGAAQLATLREQYRRSHVFRRNGADTIAAVPIVEDAPDIGEKKKTIKLSDDLGLAAALIRNSLLDYLVGSNRPVFEYDPLRFLGKEDVLHAAVPRNLTCPPWLSMRLLYEVAIRPIYFFKRKPFIGVLDRTQMANTEVARVLPG